MAASAIALLWVGLGSAAGGLARFSVTDRLARALGDAFPWGTLAVNVTGAIAIGFLAALAAAGTLPGTPASWQAVVTGFLGGYTTVSSFSLQTLALAHGGARGRAVGYAAASLAGCLVAVFLGYCAGATVAG